MLKFLRGGVAAESFAAGHCRFYDAGSVRVPEPEPPFKTNPQRKEPGAGVWSTAANIHPARRAQAFRIEPPGWQRSAQWPGKPTFIRR
jgi:hypothetical protein